MLGTGAGVALGSAGLTAHASAEASGAKNLIVVVAAGGWDVTFCHDPKFHVDFVEGPEVDAGANPNDVDAIQTFGDMQIVVNGHSRPEVGSFFKKWWTQTSLVNGMWMGSIAHQACRLRQLTGTNDPTRPDVATIVGHIHGNDKALGSIDLSGLGFKGNLAASSGQIGLRSQLKALLDKETSFDAPPSAAYSLPLFEPEQGEIDALEQFMERRSTAWRDKYGVGHHNLLAADQLLESMERRRKLLEGAQPLVDGLVIGTTPGLSLQSELAAQLLSSGLCKSLTLQHYEHWDTHTNNTAQHELYNNLFGSLDHLMEQLEQYGIMDETLVWVVSEMTRTPRRNATGGKDHWAHTSSLLLGGGLDHGKLYGGTNDNLESLPVDLETGQLDDQGEDLLTYDTMVAGVLEFCDVDPGDWLPGSAPFRGAFNS